MNGELLLIFIGLLLVLIFSCYFLGNCNKEGMTSNQTFYGPNGATAQTQNDTLIITMPDGSTTTFNLTDASLNTYSGPNGGTAKIVTNSDGTNSLVVTSSDGIVTTYNANMNNNDTSTATSSTNNNVTSTQYDNYNHYDKTYYPTIFYGPDGGTARVIQTPGNNTIVITNKNGTTDIYYIERNNPDITTAKYYGPNGGSAKMITDNNGKKAVEITGPNGNKIIYTETNTYSYNSQDNTINQYSSDTNTTGSDYNTAYTSYSGPNISATTVTGPNGNTYSTYDSSAYYNSSQGIPRSQIPPGQEDLYILKSEVVPPVCPAPVVINKCDDSNFDVSKCPPCPPCGRCSEPNFTCTKTPNYKSFDPNVLPVPVLSDFSTFGM